MFSMLYKGPDMPLIGFRNSMPQFLKQDFFWRIASKGDKNNDEVCFRIKEPPDVLDHEGYVDS